MAHRRVCDIQDGDEAWVAKFEDEIQMLTGMVLEMMEENRQLVLSPVMRRLLADKARLVDQIHGKVRGRIVVDNPAEPLQKGFGI